METSEEPFCRDGEDEVSQQDYAEHGLEQLWLKERIIYYKHERFYKLTQGKHDEYSDDDSRRIRNRQEYESQEFTARQNPSYTSHPKTTPLSITSVAAIDERKQEWVGMGER